MARKALIALVFAYSVPAFAQDRVAIVVSSDAGSVPTESMRKDAFALSETLFGIGFAVTRMENPEASALTHALAKLPKDATALLFFSGAAQPQGAEMLLVTGSTPLTLTAATTALQPAGRAGTLIFLDTCRPDALALSPPAPVPGVFLAMPTAPGTVCPAGTPSMAQEMLTRITAPGVTLTAQFPVSEADAGTGLWVQTAMSTPFTFRAATSTTVLTAADYRMLDRLSPEDRDKMLTLWAEAGIAVDVAGARPVQADLGGGGVITAVPVSPVIVQNAGVISPIQTIVSPIVSGAEVQGEALAVLVAAPAPRRTSPRPVPGAGSLPEPSIILGQEETLASLALPDAPETPPAQQLDYTDIDARKALKASDAAGYATLISTGAYDPPPDQLAFAVQTELARMNCYTRAIDGDWGNGSRRALQLYFDTLEVAAATQEPTVEVFRQLLTDDSVACPEVAAPAPAPAAAAAPRTTPRTPRTQAAPAPAPAPAPAESGRRIRQNNGTGAFR